MAADIDRRIGSRGQQLPPQQLAQIRTQVLQQTIKQELIFASLKDIECPPKAMEKLAEQIPEKVRKQNPDITAEEYFEQLGASPEQMRAQATFEMLMRDTTTDEKIQKYIEQSPASYFDGTMVKAKHILISVPFYASDEQAEQGKKKILQIAKQIEDGETTFEQAAEKYSACPSREKSGDLGSFSFEKMAAPFSKAAFAMESGEISDPVRTSFGWHLIKVTAKNPGSGKPGKKAEEMAKRLKTATLLNRLIEKGLKDNPVTIPAQ